MNSTFLIKDMADIEFNEDNTRSQLSRPEELLVELVVPESCDSERLQKPFCASEEEKHVTNAPPRSTRNFIESGASNDSESTMEGEEFSVESIVDKKTYKGNVKYLIKCRDKEEMTWVKIENLNCLDLIKEFERTRMKTKKKVCKPKESDEDLESGSAKKRKASERNSDITDNITITTPESAITPSTCFTPRISERLKQRSISYGSPNMSEKRLYQPSASKITSTTPEIRKSLLLSASRTPVNKCESSCSRRSHTILIPDRIIGARIESRELMFLVKPKEGDVGEWVPARIANYSFPQIVIRWYEDRQLWAYSSEENTPN